MDYSNASTEELEQLVDQKDGEAICELGERCMYGTKGHTQNLTRAYQLFHKGEKMGLKRAYLGLATMYEKGIYFAKNETLANDYYRKSGVQRNVNTNIRKDKVLNQPVYHNDYKNSSVEADKGISSFEIRRRIDNAENARRQENFATVKAECNDALKMLDSINAGIVSYTGTEDIDRLRIDVYWVLAYTAFNEQILTELENYLSKEGVLALHPWGTYIIAVAHRNNQSPDIVLEQDLQTLITVSQNLNLSTDEKGDVTMMIADLIVCGYGRSAGCTTKMAYDYYVESMQYGNQYAQEQLQKFRTTPTGELIFEG